MRSRLTKCVVSFLALSETFPILEAAADSPSESEPPSRFVYFVDLERAILATGEGARIRSEIRAEVEKVEEAVRRREVDLMQVRRDLARGGDSALRSKYELAVASHEALISSEEKRLDALQEAKIAPLAARFRERLKRANESGAGAVILDLVEQPILDPDKECDLTSWLIRAHDSGTLEPLSSRDACRSFLFLYVDLGGVLRSSPEGRKATERLDRFQKEKQSELDRRRAELSRIEDLRERAQLELELADRFGAYERELRRLEAMEEKRVLEASKARVRELRRELKGVLFLEKVEGVPVIEPACDATRWLADLARGEGERGRAGLRTVCPAARESVP